MYKRVADEIARAIERTEDELPVTPSTLAHWILDAHDATCGVDVVDLPARAVSVARVLAHLESFGLGLSKRLMCSIARRTTLALLDYSTHAPNRSARALIESPS